MQDELFPSNDYLLACNNYKYEKVFFLFSWEEIYKKTSTRPWNFSEVKKNCDLIVKAYNLFYYDLIEIPKNSIEKRIDFILSKI